MGVYFIIMDLYKILQVDKTSTINDIKASYKRLVKLYHPDITKLEPNIAKEKFDSLQKAYEILSDNKKRIEYDNTFVDSSFLNKKIKRQIFNCPLKLSIIDMWNGFKHTYSITSKDNKKYTFQLQWDKQKLFNSFDKSYNNKENEPFIVKYNFTFVNYESNSYIIKIDEEGNLNVIVKNTEEKFPLEGIEFDVNNLPITLIGFNKNKTIKIEKENNISKLSFQPIVVKSDSMQKLIDKTFLYGIILLMLINYYLNR